MAPPTCLWYVQLTSCGGAKLQTAGQPAKQDIHSRITSLSIIIIIWFDCSLFLIGRFFAISRRR
ncbi:hypothetical protein T4E_9435 [Trichinella pseudospiralis]|uniref:Uncharacterized protein n=1 Tax=Trichinella pseudospiralis TaxID=6337 RepID=A0A0V0XNZ4_TRIPS|nr:hypothetical protein T4E_9435 [Trichinella pseudospiralis]